MEKEGIYDLTKLNKKKIIGKYISTMYLKGFMPYNFEDTFTIFKEQKDYCPPINSIIISLNKN